jgi:glycosyltransferase involved in cell wall biosynthesis
MRSYGPDPNDDRLTTGGFATRISGPNGSGGLTTHRLAILIPVYNDQQGLERSLGSLAEDGADFDVFVIDDGSDPPVRIPPDLPYTVCLTRQQPNRGITAALNSGLMLIAKAGYQLVARLDAGDLSLPGRLAAQMAFLDGHPEHAVVGAAIRHVDTGGNFLFDDHLPTQHDRIMSLFRYRPAVIHPSVMIRMQYLLASGPYRDDFPGGEDYELLMRLGTHYKLGNVTGIFVVKERNPNSITANRRRLSLISRLRVLWLYFDPWSIHSYVGMAINASFLIVPRSLVLKLRRSRGRGHVRTPATTAIGAEPGKRSRQ